MGSPHHPKRGSHAYWPRVRIARESPRIRSWPEGGEKPKIQGFMGYKVGMTHALVIDYRPTSTTAGKEVQMPITVVECPPLKIAAVRAYIATPYGLQTLTEVWADKLDKELARRLPLPKEHDAAKGWELIEKANVEDVRVLAYTQPMQVTGVPKKVPELLEYRIGGGSVQDRIAYGKSVLGKPVDVSETMKEGDMIDVIAASKGKGFSSRVRRFNTKLLHHKNSKHRRMIGTQGPWHPNWIMSQVPNDGQLGYQQRTTYNIRVLKILDKPDEVNPAGGWKHYGLVRSKALLVHGSIPGPSKRLVRLRDNVRYRRSVKAEKPEFAYLSIASKQGV